MAERIISVHVEIGSGSEYETAAETHISNAFLHSSMCFIFSCRVVEFTILLTYTKVKRMHCFLISRPDKFFPSVR